MDSLRRRLGDDGDSDEDESVLRAMESSPVQAARQHFPDMDRRLDWLIQQRTRMVSDLAINRQRVQADMQNLAWRHMRLQDHLSQADNLRKRRSAATSAVGDGLKLLSVREVRQAQARIAKVRCRPCSPMLPPSSTVSQLKARSARGSRSSRRPSPRGGAACGGRGCVRRRWRVRSSAS